MAGTYVPGKYDAYLDDEGNVLEDGDMAEGEEEEEEADEPKFGYEYETYDGGGNYEGSEFREFHEPEYDDEEGNDQGEGEWEGEEERLERLDLADAARRPSTDTWVAEGAEDDDEDFDALFEQLSNDLRMEGVGGATKRAPRDQAMYPYAKDADGRGSEDEEDESESGEGKGGGSMRPRRQQGGGHVWRNLKHGAAASSSGAGGDSGNVDDDLDDWEDDDLDEEEFDFKAFDKLDRRVEKGKGGHDRDRDRDRDE
jgi:hypothetical protein